MDARRSWVIDSGDVAVGRALSSHWEKRLRMDNCMLAETVVVTLGTGIAVSASERRASSRVVGGLSSVELPEDERAW